MNRRLTATFAAVVTAMLAACSSGTSEAPSTTPSAGAGTADATVVVQNNSANPVDINVFIVPEAGQRRSLGSVQGNRTGTFSYVVPAAGFVTLVAQQTTDGREVTSERFRITNGDIATWNRSINRVTVGRK